MVSALILPFAPPPSAASTEAAYDEAMRLLRFAAANPSLANMAKAVDAFREFERLFETRVL